MTIKEINDNIVLNVEKEVKKTVKHMGKIGYITADNEVYRYNPTISTFNPVDPTQTIEEFNSIYNYSWNTLTADQVQQTIKEMLPGFTLSDITDFNNYNKYSQMDINDKSIPKMLKDAVKDNNSYKSDRDFKGKYDLLSQILILRNNDIFSNGKVLFKLEDGKFIVIKANGVRELLNSEIVVSGDNIPVQFVKNNYKTYLDTLTNIKELQQLMQDTAKRENIMSKSKDGYDKVMEIIAKYK